MSSWESRIRWKVYITQAQEIGEVGPDEDADYIVDDVMGLIESLSIGAIISPDRVDAKHQIALTERLLQRIAIK